MKPVQSIMLGNALWAMYRTQGKAAPILDSGYAIIDWFWSNSGSIAVFVSLIVFVMAAEWGKK